MDNRFCIMPVLSIDTVYTAFTDSYGSNFSFTGEAHPYWELDYVLEGTCGITSGTEVYTLGKGELVLHRAKVFHTAWAVNGGVSLMTISFSGMGLEHLTGGKYIPSSGESLLLELLKAETRTVITAKNQLDLACLKSLLEGLLLQLARRGSLAPPSRQAAGFMEMAGFLQANVCKNIPITRLEERFMLSGTAIRRLFRKYTGVSPVEYYNSLRAAHAALLLEKDLTVSEISDEMGFSSPSYFSSFFRKQTGKSPLQYKRDNNQAAKQIG